MLRFEYGQRAYAPVQKATYDVPITFLPDENQSGELVMALVGKWSSHQIVDLEIAGSNPVECPTHRWCHWCRGCIGDCESSGDRFNSGMAPHTQRVPT